jgi:quercetin dioxygenase-like cupin family protein
MAMHGASSALAALLLSLLITNTTKAQLMPICVENSPERQGQAGCSLIEDKLLPADVKQPLFWHVDRFESAERARAAVGPTSVAFDADGISWLMSVESRISDHHGGQHVAEIGPLRLPPASRYSMLVQSAAFPPGMYSLIHHHSGVEAIYVIRGEACYETEARGFRLQKGETLAIPTGTLHRAVVPGPALRYVIAGVIHDAAQPDTMRMEHGKGPELAACK